jgi:NIMA (never in mitosis gene a)-related kinase
MAAKQRTFEGSNLPALVNKIMKGQYAPLKGNYSDAFRQLVVDFVGGFEGMLIGHVCVRLMIC